MPRGQGATKPKGAKEIALPLKAAVICLRLFYNEEFKEIERKTGVKKSTAQHIWQRAREDAKSDDLHALLAVLGPKKRPGRPRKLDIGNRLPQKTNNSLFLRLLGAYKFN